MPAWATVTLVLGSSAIVAAVALLAAQLQLRHARHEREAAERAGTAGEGGSRGRAGSVAPQRLRTPASDGYAWIADALLTNELLERWKALRDPIVEFAAGYPSSPIGEATDKVVLAVTNALTTADWLIHDLPESWSKESLETARADNADAVKLTRALLERSEPATHPRRRAHVPPLTGTRP